VTKKLLSIDDHAIVGAGLAEIAHKVHGGGAVVGTAKDRSEALRLLRSENWDLVVLDMSLKGCSGLELLKEIKQMDQKLPVLIFSMHSGVEFVRRSLKNGAAGYVPKDCAQDRVLEAINTVLAGGKYVPPDLRDELIFSPETGTHRDLSTREFDVLIGIATGKTVREIAADLNISENTVETYRARVKAKMGINRDAELIRYCIGAGLVNADLPASE
jgi:two-component system, NarL family, invasion response regulator UvrY